MKKLPSKISTEDLLKALDSKEEVKEEIREVFDFGNDVPLFLSKYKIESGTQTITKKKLYRLYKQFSETPVNLYEFYLTVGGFIESYKDDHYLINLNRAEIHNLIQKNKPNSKKFALTSVSTRRHFELFLEETDINKGQKWVEAHVLIYLYHKWCRANKKSIRLKPKVFVSFARLYLETKRTTHQFTWFKVNEVLINSLTEDDKRKIRNDREKRQGKKVTKRQSVRSSGPQIESKE